MQATGDAAESAAASYAAWSGETGESLEAEVRAKRAADGQPVGESLEAMVSGGAESVEQALLARGTEGWS